MDRLPRNGRCLGTARRVASYRAHACPRDVDGLRLPLGPGALVRTPPVHATCSGPTAVFGTAGPPRANFDTDPTTTKDRTPRRGADRFPTPVAMRDSAPQRLPVPMRFT